MPIFYNQHLQLIQLFKTRTVGFIYEDYKDYGMVDVIYRTHDSGVDSYLDRIQALRDTSTKRSELSKIKPLNFEDSKTRRQFSRIVCNTNNVQAIKHAG